MVCLWHRELSSEQPLPGGASAGIVLSLDPGMDLRPFQRWLKLRTTHTRTRTHRYVEAGMDLRPFERWLPDHVTLPKEKVKYETLAAPPELRTEYSQYTILNLYTYMRTCALAHTGQIRHSGSAA